MIRSQIVLDEPIADQLRVVSSQSGASMSEIVRQALVAYFNQREPNLSWVGSLRQPAGRKSHDLTDIRAGVAAGRKREAKR
jgi:Arc/MetJ-type ribon-helix-helix transcriptional regulator